MSYIGLPPVPPDLKSITPYLQRAQETTSQDPIISYWCAHYAAQLGISLKAASAPNRSFLAALLTMLEKLRVTVSSSDAITDESASSAYVENFALKVFASADDEDRRGVATRKTAKKFLAAATFFDILNVFEDRGPWEAHAEKVRYAKWRAADISKAIREGRQPTPVSSGGEPAESAVDSVSAPPEPFTGLIDAPSTQFSHESEEPFSTSSLPLVPTAFGEEGTSLETPPASALVPINPSDIQAQHTVLSGSPSPPSSIRSSASVLRAHQVDAKAPSEALLPSIAPYESPVDMIQGLTSTGAASTTQSPIQAPRPSSPMDLIPQNSPPPTAPYLTGSSYASAPPLPPPPSAPYVQTHRPRPPPPPPEPSPPPELTPGLIAKTQKHCRFAISALDYEDVEQARKELHAALAILGG